jgi:prevent-host-death family protein
MKKVTMKDLKKDLSSVIGQAEAGRSILITRHNDVVAIVGPARPAGVHRGHDAGTGRLRPALKSGTKGRYLSVLTEDRGQR